MDVDLITVLFVTTTLDLFPRRSTSTTGTVCAFIAHALNSTMRMLILLTVKLIVCLTADGCNGVHLNRKGPRCDALS